MSNLEDELNKELEKDANSNTNKVKQKSKITLPKSKKMNKNIVVLLGVVALFVLMILFMSNLETEKIDDGVNNTAIKKENSAEEFNKSKVNTAPVQQEIKQINPGTEAKTDTQINEFDMNKVNATVQAENVDFNPILEENKDLKLKIETLEKEIQILKLSKLDEKKEETKQNSENMKDYLNSIKNEIKINSDSFYLKGKNYYIGDKLETYEVRDIKENGIRFCEKWCYTLFL